MSTIKVGTNAKKAMLDHARRMAEERNHRQKPETTNTFKSSQKSLRELCVSAPLREIESEQP